MVQLVTASSIQHAAKSLPYSSRKQFLGKMISMPGFSIKNSKNWFKNARNLIQTWSSDQEQKRGI